MAATFRFVMTFSVCFEIMEVSMSKFLWRIESPEARISQSFLVLVYFCLNSPLSDISGGKLIVLNSNSILHELSELTVV